ncbi:MAG: hypothetical protein U0T11_09680 [Chitinophagaceae bacterium]
MKVFYTIGAIIIFMVTNSSCTKNSTSNSAGTADLTTATWRVSYYWDTKDETSNFTDYVFMFSNTGVVMAHKGSTMITGTWSETGTKLTIDFGSDPVLSAISKKWLKTETTSTVVKMKDDNTSQDDQLHLTKL